MKLTVFNGSPRKGSSNTLYFLDRFLDGFRSAGGDVDQVLNLYDSHHFERCTEAFAAAETVLLGFPLYVDAMPTQVMAFIEELAQFRGRAGNPDVLFFVQSGFPEAFHSRPVERYLDKLARRLHCRHVGTIVKGGGEGVRSMPEWMTRKVLDNFRELGKRLAVTGELDKALLKKVAGPERLTGLRGFITSLLLPTIGKSFWNGMLKKNKAFDRRYARPLEGGPRRNP